ncbi:MAG: hypothetical protein GY756_03835, partial [bacterium]|nr:hypothetical protein [bacterium]
ELINKLDKEIYTIFLAVVPKAEDDFIVVGSNVHFRPNIPDTVIAPIRNNKITTRPKVLPPNYLMAPETAESILDLYFREPSYLEKDLFNIDVGFDEKLLFIQGSNTKIVSTFDGRWLPKSTSIAAPSTHTPNPVLFISNGIEYICEAEVFEMSTLGDNYYSKILSKYYNSLKNPIAYTIDINRDNITGKNSGTLVIRQNQFITNSNVLYSKMNLSFNNGEITSAEVDVDFDADDSKQRFIPNTDRVGNLSKERT